MKETKDLTAIFANPVALSFEAEESAKVSKEYMLKICCPALHHEKSYVREGALYGMAKFMNDIDIRAMMTTIAESDPDGMVRSIASELLDTHKCKPYPGMEFELPITSHVARAIPEPCRTLLKHVIPNNYIKIDMTI
jgi:hypothetical protein